MRANPSLRSVSILPLVALRSEGLEKGSMSIGRLFEGQAQITQKYAAQLEEMRKRDKEEYKQPAQINWKDPEVIQFIKECNEKQKKGELVIITMGKKKPVKTVKRAKRVLRWEGMKAYSEQAKRSAERQNQLSPFREEGRKGLNVNEA